MFSKRLVLSLLIAAVASCLLAGCATARASKVVQPPFRVMTFNIHHGEGLDGKLDLERIAAVIQQQGADIVSLQEVDKGLQRTARRDMPAELARLTGMTCVFSNNFATQGGEYGNAILSRFPVVSTTNHPLPKISANEPRGLLEARLQLPAGPVRFMATHLDHRSIEEDRLAGVERIRQVIESDPQTPVIIAGDFNAAPNSETYRRLTSFLTDAWTASTQDPGYTIPATKPNRRIDYIFYRAPRLQPGNPKVVATPSSDHLPVVVEFTVTNP